MLDENTSKAKFFDLLFVVVMTGGTFDKKMYRFLSEELKCDTKSIDKFLNYAVRAGIVNHVNGSLKYTPGQMLPKKQMFEAFESVWKADDEATKKQVKARQVVVRDLVYLFSLYERHTHATIMKKVLEDLGKELGYLVELTPRSGRR